MFYRIKDEKVYDYADYEYAKDCLYSDFCTMSEFQQHPDFYCIKEGKLDYIENYEEIIVQKRKEQFEKEFFNTSLGWIRRRVTMKDGSIKDFLVDLLMPIKAGMDLGQNVELITYNTPDFTKEPTLDYMESLQEIKFATFEFIRECLFQTVHDFGLLEENQQTVDDVGGNNGI